MADGKIRAEDLVDKEAFKVYDELAAKAVAALEKITTEVAGLTQAYQAMVTTLGSAETKEAQAIKNRQRLADLTAETKAKEQALKQAKIELKSVEEQYTIVIQNQERRKRELILTEEKEIKLKIQQKRLTGDVESAYKKLSKQLVVARNKAKDLAVTDGELSKSFLVAQREVTKLDAKLKRIDASLGQNQRSVGNYGLAVKNLAGGFRSLASAFGFAGGIFLFASILKDSFKRVKELDQAIYDLAGTLNVSRFEIQDLEEDAIKLGGATKFTAAQIVDLQKQLAKKGFVNSEILDSTEAIINLAVATGEDLSKSAEVASATLRAMGLETSEMSRVVNVMASSFTKTALDLEAFTESAKFVTPIARKANISLEELTSLLGVLADNGIKGSIAGTGLRKIISELDKSAIPLNERIKQLAEAYLTLGDATDEVGQRAQTSLLVLTSEIEIADELKESFELVGDVAKEMADTKMKSLENRIILLDSAWDRLIQRKARDNDISFKLGKALDYLTKNIEVIATNVYKAVRAFVIYKAVVIATSGAVKVIQGLMAIGRVVWTLYAVGIRAATAAMIAFNAASAASIIGAIAGAIALAVLAFQYFTAEVEKSVVAVNKLLALRQKLDKDSKEILSQYKKDYRAGLKEIEDDLLLQGKTEEEIALARIKYTEEYLAQQKQVRNHYRQQSNDLDEQKKKVGELREYEKELQNQIDNGGDKEALTAELKKTKAEADGLAAAIFPVQSALITAVKTTKFLGLELVKLKNNVRPEKDLTKEEQNAARRAAEKAATLADKKAKYELDLLIEEQKVNALNNKIILDDKEASYGDQLEAAEKYFDAIYRIQELELEKGLIGWKKTAEERAVIEAQAATKLITIANNKKKAEAKIETANVAKVLKDLKDITAARTRITNEEIAQKIEAYRIQDELDVEAGKSQLTRALKRQELEEEIQKIRLQGDIISQGEEIEFLEKIIATLDPTIEGVQELIDMLAALKAELLDLPAPETSDFEQWASKVTTVLENVRDQFEYYASFVENSIGLLLANEVEAADQAIQANEDKYSRLIDLAQNDENLKTRLENERARKEEILEKKKKKALQKQAAFEKAMGISRALINTAIGVTSAFANPGGPLGVILAGIIAALGAVEVAAIASAPIPNFEHGGTMKYDGVALVGEKRHEVVKEPGKAPWITGNKPQLSRISKGSVIYPSLQAASAAGVADLHRAAIMTSVNADAKSMNSAQAQREFNMNYELMGQIMGKAVKRQPIVTKTNVKVDLDDFLYRNNTL